MAYIINKTNGQQLITSTLTSAGLLDGTIDTSTSITLIGKNHPSYGELQNENFIRLLENGSNDTAPLNPLTGELWYDTSSNKLKLWDGTKFKSTGTSTGETAPTGPSVGDVWWDTTNEQLKAYRDPDWQVIGPPYSKSQGKSGALVETIIDSTNATHLVIIEYLNGNIFSITNADADFTPKTTITGFPTVRKGVNYRLGGDQTFVITRGTQDGSVRLLNATSNANVDLQVTVNDVTVSSLRIDGSTGEAQTAADPITALGLTTKQYVDKAIGGVSLTEQGDLVSLESKLKSNVALINSNVAVIDANLGTATTNISSLQSLKAPINNPILTGTPKAVTRDVGDSSENIATTAFVKNAIGAAADSSWQGAKFTVSTSLPDNGIGNDGDFWFQV